jgi:hypothetical protein
MVDGSATRAQTGLLASTKTYSLTVPKDVPVGNFWSLTVYDMATWAFI